MLFALGIEMRGQNFPKTELRKAGYSAVWEGQNHGTASPFSVEVTNCQ